MGFCENSVHILPDKINQHRKENMMINKRTNRIKSIVTVILATSMIVSSVIPVYAEEVFEVSENEDTVSEEAVQRTERKKLLKKLASLENHFTDLDPSIYSQEDLQEMKAEAIPLINVIMQRLDIDAGEL